MGEHCLAVVSIPLPAERQELIIEWRSNLGCRTAARCNIMMRATPNGRTKPYGHSTMTYNWSCRGRNKGAERRGAREGIWRDVNVDAGECMGRGGECEGQCALGAAWLDELK